MVHKFMDNYSNEETQPTPKSHDLPFNNLFLNTGFVEGGNKFWMYLFGISATILGYLFIGSLLVLPLMSRALKMGVTQTELLANQYIVFDPVRLDLNKNIILMVQFGLFVAAFLGLLFSLRLIHRKRLLSVITAFEKFRYNHFFFGFGIWAVMVMITFVITYVMNSENLVWQFDAINFFQLFIVCIIFLPIQTLTEEIIFRGYLLQGLSQVFKNGIVPVLITSMMFGTAHLSNPEAGAFGASVMLTYYVVFAIFLGGITLMSEGIELAFGIHLANNLLSSLIVTSPNSVLKTDALFYARTENANVDIALSFVALIIVFFVFRKKYGWKDFSLVIR